ncbi:MAG: cytochrome c peroxidase [Chthoniobacter sp.]|uniref:cytochrome-c peroxidase n=1 Tax=Chthoniobacter sp. TaxID=2510640 RepID=UPI0032A54E9F
MFRSSSSIRAILSLLAGFAALCTRATEPGAEANEPVRPLPQHIAIDSAKAKLGAKLFFDPQLSGDNSVSCGSCHHFDHGGADYGAHSNGVAGKVGGVNSPSIYNLAFDFRYNWNGAAETLHEHLDLPMRNPVVMATDFPKIVEKLKHSGDYPQQFSAVFHDGLTEQAVKDALVEYERSLITPDCRFDQWLRGDKKALNDREIEGYHLFKSLGCTSCHQGVNIGGNLFQKFGVMGDYFTDRGNITKADFGRFNLTNDERDRFVFRVPSLRNVAMTAPYFHDGSAATLPDAVRIMASYQLGRSISEEEISRIVAFLSTLTGELRQP